jgi:hypothetical protein
MIADIQWLDTPIRTTRERRASMKLTQPGAVPDNVILRSLDFSGPARPRGSGHEQIPVEFTDTCFTPRIKFG